MNRLLLALAFTAILAAPASASTGRMQSELQGQHTSQRHEKMSIERSEYAKAQLNDPYWTPCDYFSDFGDNSCE
jgi:hypothetical protein